MKRMYLPFAKFLWIQIIFNEHLLVYTFEYNFTHSSKINILHAKKYEIRHNFPQITEPFIIYRNKMYIYATVEILNIVLFISRMFLGANVVTYNK